MSLLLCFVIRYIISYADNRRDDESPDWRGFTLAALFFMSGLGHTVFFSQAAFQIMRLGLEIKIALIGLIYKKVLKVKDIVNQGGPKIYIADMFWDAVSA